MKKLLLGLAIVPSLITTGTVEASVFSTIKSVAYLAGGLAMLPTTADICINGGIQSSHLGQKLAHLYEVDNAAGMNCLEANEALLMHCGYFNKRFGPKTWLIGLSLVYLNYRLLKEGISGIYAKAKEVYTQRTLKKEHSESSIEA